MWPPPVDVIKNEEWWNQYWRVNAEKGFGEVSKGLIKWMSQPQNGELALDIASGNGRYATCLAKMGYQTTALELTSSGVDNINRIAEDCKLPLVAKKFNFLTERFEFEKADIAICSGLLEEIPVDTHALVIAKFSDCLKDNGLMIHRYCLEIEGRASQIHDGTVISLYDKNIWDIVYYEERKTLKHSKGGYKLRHGTIISRLREKR